MGVAAALLGAAVVLGLIYVRGGSTTRMPVPAKAPTIPIAVLEQAHVAPAEHLLSYPKLEGEVNGYRISLVAAYADAHHVALIFSTRHPSIPLHGLAYTGLRLFLENPSAEGLLWGAPDDYVTFDQWTEPPTGPDGRAHLEGAIDENGVNLTRIPAPHSPVPPDAVPPSTASGSRPPAQTWSWSYSLPVERAIPLPNPHGTISDGPWTYRVRNFELTPTAIFLDTEIEGPVLQDLPDPSKLIDELVLVDGGITVRAAAGSLRSPQGASPKAWRQVTWWPRPNKMVVLRLVITGGGGYYAADVLIPAPPQSWPATSARMN